jgi:hypothetical protein
MTLLSSGWRGMIIDLSETTISVLCVIELTRVILDSLFYLVKYTKADRNYIIGD